MKQIGTYTILLLIIIVLQSCHGTKTATPDVNRLEEQQMKGFIPADGPRAIVYKTTNDYSAYVPATMNAPKDRIVSYPDPSDIYYKGELAKPTALDKGYWLDNRGIGENTVFLKYTYEEYAQLKKIPSLEEMKENILDYYPFVEIVDCGARYQYGDERKELNQLINEGFPNCKITPMQDIAPAE